MKTISDLDKNYTDFEVWSAKYGADTHKGLRLKEILLVLHN